jgi:hypothetical protein
LDQFQRASRYEIEADFSLSIAGYFPTQKGALKGNDSEAD